MNNQSDYAPADVRNFVDDLIGGKYDDRLDYLLNSVQERKKQINSYKIWDMNVGDRVRMVNANPKYLNGAMATVRKINRTKIVIDLDEKQGRFFRNITTPLSMVEKV